MVEPSFNSIGKICAPLTRFVFICLFEFSIDSEQHGYITGGSSDKV